MRFMEVWRGRESTIKSNYSWPINKSAWLNSLASRPGIWFRGTRVIPNAYLHVYLPIDVFANFTHSFSARRYLCWNYLTRCIIDYGFSRSTFHRFKDVLINEFQLFDDPCWKPIGTEFTDPLINSCQWQLNAIIIRDNIVIYHIYLTRIFKDIFKYCINMSDCISWLQP